jgi:membrane protein implicated in regulation of membrane protease activity
MDIAMGPLIWLGIVALFLVIEAATVGLTTIWFAGGALIAAIAAWIGAGEAVQWILFIAVSLVLLIFTRPVAVRYMNKDVEKTNVERLMGQKAVVIQEIDNLNQTGLVRVGDVEWMARTKSDDVQIPEKAVVVIKEVQGVKLIVEEVKEG